MNAAVPTAVPLRHRACVPGRRPAAGRGGVHRDRGGAAGMTLVELLVSLVILTILASLSMAGLAVARTSARTAKTQATIRKISELLLDYYEQYETRRPNIDNTSTIAAMPRVGRANLADAKQIAIRRLMTLELPERASDYRDAFTMSGGLIVPVMSGPTYNGVTATLRDVPPVARRYFTLTLKPDGTFADVTSSELLHLIVTRGPVADPDIISHFRDDEVRDTNGNGLLEFVDGWNKPIAFRRWPVGFASPMQPIDGTARSIEPLISGNGHRLVPLVFSAGPDGAFDVASLGGYDAAVSTSVPTPPGFSYAAQWFNPFAMTTSGPGTVPLGTAADASTIAGSVVLAPTQLSSGAATGALVFMATRISAAGSLPSGAFLTVGSETDTGDSEDEAKPDGILQSRDNITNHDMSR